MKIGWLHDHRIEEHPGGAQLTNEAVIAGAPKWAEVVRCYPGEMHDAEAYILNNVKYFSFQELQQATDTPYVIFEHDCWNILQEWQAGRVKGICNGAKAMVFLSPLHRDTFLAMHRVTPREVYLVPSAIDPEYFMGGQERDGTIWIGTFDLSKGIVEAVEWAAANGPVDFYGWGPEPPSGPNVRCYGWVDYQDIPDTLAQYERFLFLPSWPEAFGRTVAEAYLSGCQLVCNENVGALSWGWETREEWVDGVGSAPARFWQIMEDVLWA
jgi:glycosyltransferase involved in cell wall biosynthesis